MRAGEEIDLPTRTRLRWMSTTSSIRINIYSGTRLLPLLPRKEQNKNLMDRQINIQRPDSISDAHEPSPGSSAFRRRMKGAPLSPKQKLIYPLKDVNLFVSGEPSWSMGEEEEQETRRKFSSTAGQQSEVVCQIGEPPQQGMQRER